MIEMLFSLLILLIIGGLLWYVITLLPLAPVVKQVAEVILILIFVLVLISALMGQFPLLKIR